MDHLPTRARTLSSSRAPDPPPEQNRLHARQDDEGFFRQLVAGMRNGVLAITRDGTIALINDEAYRVMGLEPRSTDVGRPVVEVLRDVPDVLRVLADVFEVTLLANRAELRIKSTGTVIGYTLAHVRADSGEVTGASMFFKDLTRVEQLEERERLRDRLAAVGEMAATLAHEVKNPLAGIEVIAGLLRRRLPDAPETQALLTDIINEAKMANAIVQEVLDFVRPMRLHVEPTSVSAAVQAAASLAGTCALRGQTELVLTLPADLPLTSADPHQLTQVFTNLLTNAYEALEGAGRVTVTARAVPRNRRVTGSRTRDPRVSILVEVADSGPGLAPEVAERIFDPFFTTKAKGSGLGLAVVRKIVDAHDGRLDLRTAPGEGTVIAVTLPVPHPLDEDADNGTDSDRR